MHSGSSQLGYTPGSDYMLQPLSSAASSTNIDDHANSNSLHGMKASLLSPASGSHNDDKSNEGSNQNEETDMDGENNNSDEDRKKARERELEQDAAIDTTPFAFKPYQLAQLVDSRNLDALTSFGGPVGLLSGLLSNEESGLSSDFSVLCVPSDHARSCSHSADTPPGRVSLEDRRRVFGENLPPTRTNKDLLELMMLTLRRILELMMLTLRRNRTLIFLLPAATFALITGIVVDALGLADARRPRSIAGAAALFAPLVTATVSLAENWQKERHLRVLREKKEERLVKVFRDGAAKVVENKEVVVGDIVLVEPGDIIPCDGIFLFGHNVKCDESGATGESDAAIRKVPYNDMVELSKNTVAEGKDPRMLHRDCFMLSGSKVLEGVGRYVVTAGRTKTFDRRSIRTLCDDIEDTPLQLKLSRLATISACAALLYGFVLLVMFITLFGGKVHNARRPKDVDPSTPASTLKGIIIARGVADFCIIPVIVFCIVSAEGLPLAIALALAFATKRMTKDNLYVRVLASCEHLASASVICTDKTGTLTTNSMSVVAGSVGVTCQFARLLHENAAQARSNVDETEQQALPGGRVWENGEYFTIDQADLNNALSPSARKLFNEAICINSTAFRDTNASAGEVAFLGSKTETALLHFAANLGWEEFQAVREGVKVIQMLPFSSERKVSGVVVERPTGGFRFYSKGGSEILSKGCSRSIVVRKSWGSDSGELVVAAIADHMRDNISRTITFYANQSLRTIALAYRDFSSWPPPQFTLNEENKLDYDDLLQEMTLIAILGIKDPLRPGVTESIAQCHLAGVTVKMCTGDNVDTARSIATQCGILTPGGLIMEGPDFRKLCMSKRLEIAPQLQVLARSSPQDKKTLVDTLKSVGEIVCVTGDGTNDGLVLKAANVGFAMGVSGTEVARDASDIILMDDNFASIVRALIWGRCINDAVRKVLQFKTAAVVASVVYVFAPLILLGSVEPLQLLWIKIITDLFAALAFGTDHATEALLHRKPDRKNNPLISYNMFKMILLQSVGQIIISCLWSWNGIQWLGRQPATSENRLRMATLVFNAFVFAQIFNLVNCRRLDNKLNIFEDITKNRSFIGIALLAIGTQVVIIFYGGPVFQVTRLDGREWGISLALGFLPIPWGAVIRCMPNGPFHKLFDAVYSLIVYFSIWPTGTPDWQDQGGWTGALALVQNDQSNCASIPGTRSQRPLSPVSERQNTLSILTMAPTMMMAAAAVGDKYKKEEGSLLDSGDNAESSGTPPSALAHQALAGDHNIV